MLMMFTLSFQWPFSAQRMTENEAPNICSSWTGSVSSVSYGKKKTSEGLQPQMHRGPNSVSSH